MLEFLAWYSEFLVWYIENLRHFCWSCSIKILDTSVHNSIRAENGRWKTLRVRYTLTTIRASQKLRDVRKSSCLHHHVLWESCFEDVLLVFHLWFICFLFLSASFLLLVITDSHVWLFPDHLLQDPELPSWRLMNLETSLLSIFRVSHGALTLQWLNEHDSNHDDDLLFRSSWRQFLLLFLLFPSSFFRKRRLSSWLWHLNSSINVTCVSASPLSLWSINHTRLETQPQSIKQESITLLCWTFFLVVKHLSRLWLKDCDSTKRTLYPCHCLHIYFQIQVLKPAIKSGKEEEVCPKGRIYIRTSKDSKRR